MKGTTTHLGLLGGLLLLLLSLGLADSSKTLLSTDSGGLVALGSNGGEVSTDDTTLVLHRPAGALLGNFLSDTLLVHAPVDLSPGDLTGVLALQEERCILGRGKAEDLYSDEKE
jgi:hypothetical protein